MYNGLMFVAVQLFSWPPPSLKHELVRRNSWWSKLFYDRIPYALFAIHFLTRFVIQSLSPVPSILTDGCWIADEICSSMSSAVEPYKTYSCVLVRCVGTEFNDSLLVELTQWS
jgi:hypothetical protein